jgi:hypothetical protein
MLKKNRHCLHYKFWQTDQGSEAVNGTPDHEYGPPNNCAAGAEFSGYCHENKFSRVFLNMED